MIRDAKEKVDDAKRDIQIANIQKEIDLIETEKDSIQEEIDLLDERKDAINEYYDSIVEGLELQKEALEQQKEEIEKYYDALIKALEKQKTKFEELQDIFEEAKMKSLLEELGVNEEALLNGSEEEFQKLKDAYLGICADLSNASDSVRENIGKLGGYDGQVPSFLNETNDVLDEVSGNLDIVNGDLDATNTKLSTSATNSGTTATNVGQASDNAFTLSSNIGEAADHVDTLKGNVDSLITEEQTAFANLEEAIRNVIQAIDDKIEAIQREMHEVGANTSQEIADFLALKEKITEVKDEVDNLTDSVNLVDKTPIDDLTTSFNNLYTELSNIGLTAEDNAITRMSKAIQDLNEISLAEGIIAQFTNLKKAVEAVTAAIGGGGGGASAESGGDASNSQSASMGGESGSSGGGSGDSLTDSITQMGETAAEVIGEPEAEGDGTVIGEFGSMKTAVENVRDTIGSGEDDEESDIEGGTLSQSITNLKPTAEASLGEQGGGDDRVIPRFEQLNEVVEEVDSHLENMLSSLQELVDGSPWEIEVKITSSGGIGGIGEALGNLDLGNHTWVARYGKADADGNITIGGNAFVTGGKCGAEKDHQALVGELGPELRVRGQNWELLGLNGSEFADIKKGDIIFNHKQTEQLLKNGKISGRGKAYADGTIGLYPPNLRPLQPGDQSYDLIERWKEFTKGKSINDILPPLNQINDNMGKMVQSIQNNSNVMNNSNQSQINLNIGDIVVQGVQDTNGLARAIVTRLPNAILQEIHKH